MEALPCLGKDAHIYCSNWREPKCHLTHQKSPSYQKVKGHQAWKPAACCQCIWPKAEQTDGDRAAPAALLHPGLHHCSNPEQGLTVPVLLQNNSLSYKAGGNRNQAPVPKPPVWLHMIVYAERVQRGQGDAGYRHRKQPKHSLYRQHHALGFSGEHTPASTASLLPTWASACPCALASSSCKEKEASCQEAAGQEIPRAVLLSPTIIWVRKCKLSNLVQALPVVTPAPTALINSAEKLQQRSNNRARKYSSLCFLSVNWWHKKDSQVHVFQSANRCCDILKGKGPTASAGVSVISI